MDFHILARPSYSYCSQYLLRSPYPAFQLFSKFCSKFINTVACTNSVPLRHHSIPHPHFASDAPAAPLIKTQAHPYQSHHPPLLPPLQTPHQAFKQRNTNSSNSHFKANTVCPVSSRFDSDRPALCNKGSKDPDTH